MSDSSMLLLRDPARLLLSPEGFECGEFMNNDEDDEDDRDEDQSSILFYITTPSRDRLEFQCRGRSQNVLMEKETSDVVSDEELATEGMVDPNFFDQGYTLAGRTGFQVWAGSRLLMETIIWSKLLLHHNIMPLQRGPKVLELGSGVGVVGMALAHEGAHVCMTDLPTLVEHSLLPNARRNNSTTMDGDVMTVGQGTVRTVALDWTLPVDQQLSASDTEGLDMIVASDCVWLSSMLESLLDTVASIFVLSSPVFIMSFQRRDSGGDSSSNMFTTVEGVIEAIQARNWNLECLSWRPLEDDDTKEVYVFEITTSAASTRR